MHDRRRQAVADLAIKHAREMSDLMEGGLGAAREKFKELFLMTLEGIENKELREEWEQITKGSGEDLTFFSEVALYSLIGKQEARTVLARLRALGEALGFSDMEMHRDFKSENPRRAGPKDYPSQDDIDALEVILRDEAAYMLGSEVENKIVPLMRTLGLMREMVGAHPFGEGVQYVRCYPKELKIGDRIAADGKWVDVLGFLDHGKFSETPVPDEMSDLDRERRHTEPYWGAHVKTRENDTHGWPVRSQDQYIVQRQVHPEGDGPERVDKPQKSG